jgi:hypothetical protein
LWGHFREITYPNKLTLIVHHLEKRLGLNILNGNLQLPNTCLAERGTTDHYPAQHINPKEGQGPEKAPTRRDSTQIRNRKNVPSALTQLRGSPLFLRGSP